MNLFTTAPIGQRAGALLVAAFLAAGCAEHESARQDATAPELLSATGLVLDAAGEVLTPGVRSFTPQYALWTDGAAKRRWILLPEGAAIDAADPEVWSFPIGTKLWKEFSFGARVETRYMERLASGEWLYATYLWSEDAADAVLAPKVGARGVCETALGTRHDVPSVLDCRACHEAHPSRVLGFSALQLAEARDPLAPNAEEPQPGDLALNELLERGLVRGDRSLVIEASTPLPASTSPRERAALGYLHANCSGCHNAWGPLASLGLDLGLRHDEVPPALRTTLNVRSHFTQSGTGHTQRLVAGAPLASVLYQRIGSRFPATQMPPLGTHAPDAEAIALVRDWINEDLALHVAAVEPNTGGR
jgi:hypothetical protein